MSGKNYPRHRDWQASDRVRELRENEGLSRSELAQAIERLASKPGRPYTVSRKTIDRIEEMGAEPTVRVKFAIARFFELDVTEIWSGNRARTRA